MTTYAYTARDQTGSPASGTFVANSVQEVSQMLRADGKYPTSIVAAAEPVADSGWTWGNRGMRLPRKDLIQFSTQLAIMVETGVTLSEALDCIAAQTEKPNVKKLFAEISEQVQGGNDFSSVLQKHPRAFPRLFVALVAASEKSGMMGKLLNRATQYLRDEYDTIRKVRGALTYPAIMMAFAISTTTFLLTFVLPKFTAIYAQKGAALPVPTRILMAISGFIIGNWLILLLSLIILAIVAFFFFSSDTGKRTYYFAQINVPLFGSVFRKLHLARGLRIVGTMAGAGVSLVECVKTAGDLCGNGYFRDLWEEVSQQIQAGKQLSEPMFSNPLAPKSVSQMLSSAEKAGKLAQVMEQVATYSEQELKEKIDEMTRYIEPLMIAVMGGIIGSVAIALMLPIFSISKVITK
jgi:type IV pilus assembly protein PilC